jgi:hypothetical protein
MTKQFPRHVIARTLSKAKGTKQSVERKTGLLHGVYTERSRRVRNAKKGRMESMNEAEKKTKEVGAMKTLKYNHRRKRISAFLYFFAVSFFLLTLEALDERLTEASHAATFNVTTEAELQDALTEAQGNGEDDTINIAAGTYDTSDNGGNPFTYTADSDEDFSLTVNGAGAATTILDGGNSTPVLIIDLFFPRFPMPP